MLFLSVASHAQGITGPTDVELKAAYCIPVLQANIKMVAEFSEKLVGSTNDVDRRVLGQLAESRTKLDDDLKRVRAYVLPKLAGSNGGEYLTGFSAATQRGNADVEASKAAVTRCGAACPQIDLQCVQACLARNPANLRVQVCHAIDWLPF